MRDSWDVEEPTLDLESDNPGSVILHGYNGSDLRGLLSSIKQIL